jgi:hypothetical protein
MYLLGWMANGRGADNEVRRNKFIKKALIRSAFFCFTRVIKCEYKKARCCFVRIDNKPFIPRLWQERQKAAHSARS